MTNKVDTATTAFLCFHSIIQTTTSINPFNAVFHPANINRRFRTCNFHQTPTSPQPALILANE